MANNTIIKANLTGLLYQIITAVFSFEVVFVLFLFAGRYKADPRFAWVPVDITALFFGLSILLGGQIFLRRGLRFHRRGLSIVFVALLLVLWCIASLIWSPGQVYATEKALYIATLTIWPLVATALIIAPDSYRFQRFMLAVVMFAVWMAIEATFYYLRLRNVGFVSVMGGNYLGLGRTVGLAALIVIVLWLFEEKRSLRKIIWICLFFLFIFVVLIGGGRGPFIATIVGLLLPAAIGLKISRGGIIVKRYSFSLIGLLVLTFCVETYLLAMGYLTTTLQRLLIFIGGNDLTSAGLRFKWYKEAVALWAQAPVVGHGIGSWPVLIGLGDVRSYPHNLLLELAVELGIVGLLLMLTLLAVGLYSLKLRHAVNDQRRLLVLILFTNTLINALVSGDIPDNRIMFAMLGLMALKTEGGS